MKPFGSLRTAIGLLLVILAGFADKETLQAGPARNWATNQMPFDQTGINDQNQSAPDMPAGLQIPSLEPLVRHPEQLITIANKYEAFSESGRRILTQAEAYGLTKQLPNVNRVSQAAAYWKKYFTDMQIFPDTPNVLKKEDIRRFYARLAVIDAQVATTVSRLNRLIDYERTRPWVEK